MRDGNTEGMQHFDGEIEKLIREGIVDFETGLSYATNPGNLRLELADLRSPGDKARRKRVSLRRKPKPNWKSNRSLSTSPLVADGWFGK
jgi:Tfp pilus assembly ATPase PilU